MSQRLSNPEDEGLSVHHTGSTGELSQTASKEAPPKSEFEQATQKIEDHKRVIDTLKTQIQVLQNNNLISGAEIQELQCLKSCLKKEMQTLNCVIQTAIDKQIQNPSQPWSAITMPTTLEEDDIPHLMFYPPETIQSTPEPKPKRKKSNRKEPSQKMSTDLNATISTASSRSGEMGSEEVEANIRYRDMMINCLQQKMQCLSEQLCKLCNEQKLKVCPPCPVKTRSVLQKKICCPAVAAKQMRETAEHASGMQEQLENMAKALEKLQLELKYVQKERNELVKYKSIKPDEGKESVDDNDELVHQNNTLLCQLAKKEREVNYLQDKVAQMHQAASEKSDETIEISRVNILNERIKDLKDEVEDSKLLISEQQQQITDYRSKFLQAQQTVIEQRSLLDCIDSNKQQIDQQIANEVNRIKTRFQEKLKNLAPLPRLLESEQFKVKTLTAKNDDLESQNSNLNTQVQKYRKELNKLTSDGDGGNCVGKRANAEINRMKKMQDEMATQNRDLIEQLQIAHQELQSITLETNRHLSKTKERTECSKETAQKRIDALEIELAETRAKSALQLSERDKNIQNMQNQLRDISRHFAEAQTQIRSLTKRMSTININGSE